MAHLISLRRVERPLMSAIGNLGLARGMTMSSRFALFGEEGLVAWMLTHTTGCHLLKDFATSDTHVVRILASCRCCPSLLCVALRDVSTLVVEVGAACLRDTLSQRSVDGQQHQHTPILVPVAMRRFVRLFRLVHTVRAFHSFRIVVLGIMQSMTSLYWCFFVIGFIIYMFAVFFLNGVPHWDRLWPFLVVACIRCTLLRRELVDAQCRRLRWLVGLKADPDVTNINIACVGPREREVPLPCKRTAPSPT